MDIVGSQIRTERSNAESKFGATGGVSSSWLSEAEAPFYSLKTKETPPGVVAEGVK
jgi:hypothetical protein